LSYSKKEAPSKALHYKEAQKLKLNKEGLGVRDKSNPGPPAQTNPMIDFDVYGFSSVPVKLGEKNSSEILYNVE
jgi:hypothetical protein